MKRLTFYLAGTLTFLAGIWCVSAVFGIVFRLLGVA